MKFGVNLAGFAQFAAETPGEEQFREILEFTRLARDFGYDYICFGQHYLTDPFQMFQAVPLVSRLTAETGDMHVGMTLEVPLHHPVELAEHLATLDVLSGGRSYLSAATGYRRPEFDAFGIDYDTRGARSREAVALIRRLWTEPSVDFHGRFFELEGAGISLMPVQDPRPAIWIAASDDGPIRRAARAGLPWHVGPHANFPTIERQTALHRQEAAAAGWEPIQLAMGRELYCAPTTEEAWDDAAPSLIGKYAAYSDWGQDDQMPEDDMSFRSGLERLSEGRFIVGSPADCIEQLSAYADLGIGAIHMRMGWPGMAAAHIRRSLELVAKEVVPALRERFGDRGGVSPFTPIAP